jgi:hypothetical protein
MIKKDLVICVLATFCLVSTMFIVLPRSGKELISTAGALSQYDPWCDIDGSGKIDILDVVQLTSRYGTTGDPTRNVTITNWPTSQDVLVWWNSYLGPNSNINSPVYNAGGFGHLHVLLFESGLSTGQTATVNFDAYIWNQTRTSEWTIVYYTYALTPSNSYTALTVDVPSETFGFNAFTGASTSCHIYLRFYLTWS